MSAGEVAKNRYEDILSFEVPDEVRDRMKQEASFLAFYGHLRLLGRVQNDSPNLVDGLTKISVPAYFKLERYSQGNPVNNAALELLPIYSYSSGYGDTVQSDVDSRGLQSVIALPENEIEAARKGKASSFVVAKALGLMNTHHSACIVAMNRFPVRRRRLYPQLEDVSMLVEDIVKDFNEAAIDDVSVIAERVKKNGYVDFLDYLVDVQSIVSERVETVFSHEAPPIK